MMNDHEDGFFLICIALNTSSLRPNLYIISCFGTIEAMTNVQ